MDTLNLSEEKATKERAKVRGNPGDEAPFVWAAQGALDSLRELYSSSSKARTARSIYLALVEISNDRGAVFEVTHKEIAYAAELEGRRWLSPYLEDFERANLIRIERPNGRLAKWRYALLSVGRGVIGRSVLGHGKKERTSQQYIKKKLKKEKYKRGGVQCC
jgi:hypothetical protein